MPYLYFLTKIYRIKKDIPIPHSNSYIKVLFYHMLIIFEDSLSVWSILSWNEIITFSFRIFINIGNWIVLSENCWPKVYFATLHKLLANCTKYWASGRRCNSYFHPLLTPFSETIKNFLICNFSERTLSIEFIGSSLTTN